MSAQDGSRARPRVWPALLVLFLTAPAAFVFQIPIAVAVAVIGALRSQGNVEAGIEALFALPSVFLALLIAAQLAYAAAATLPVLDSPVPVTERLGLVRGRLSAAAYPFLMLGTLFMGFLGELLWGLVFDEPSANMITISKAFSEAPLPMGVCLLVVASLLPGMFEELVCRGYVQRRLLQRWPPFLAIALTSVVFALMHFDPQHIVGVLPGAFWLGYVAWRSDSTWPSIACHIVLNAVSISFLVFSDPAPLMVGEPVIGGLWLAVTVPAFGVAVVLLERAGRRAPASREHASLLPGASHL